MSTHLDRISLGDAAVVDVTITAEGVLADVTVLDPAWAVVVRRPTPGLLRRRRPADHAAVIVRCGEGVGALEWELEVGRLDDGSWEHAVREQWPQPVPTPVDTPAGRINGHVAGDRLALEPVEPAPGWHVRTQEVDDDQVVVVLDRGDEEWEVVVVAGSGGADPTTVEREHRWRIAPVPG